jgi:putative ABC transport system ATP-binding protein
MPVPSAEADREPSVFPEPDAVVLSSVTRIFERGGPVAALTDLSLRVEAGALVAIMGPSGSGKSTLLNLIGGLDRPTRGSVVVNGTDLAGLDEAELSRLRRTQVAFVFQAYHLLPTLTCADNVALPLYLQAVRRRDVEDRVSRVLAEVGLTARSTHLPDQLSGGERQRAAIARALVVKPRLLLADEPTGNLDSASGEQVLSVLQSVCQARGATLVMVTHSDQAARICDRIVHLRDGRIEHDQRA